MIVRDIMYDVGAISEVAAGSLHWIVLVAGSISPRVTRNNVAAHGRLMTAK